MILTRYLLREHIRPFVFALMVIVFILIMDFIITIADMVFSKGLDIRTVLELFVYNIAWMVALAVPMAVLVATLMAFGRMSADNEITALKTSGISVLRLIRPILVAAGLLAVLLMVFYDQVLPQFNLKAKNLMSDIRRKKPTLALKEGVFINSFPGYSLLFEKIDPKTSGLRGITIYEHKDRVIPLTIIAESGQLQFSPDGTTLTLRLENGEIHEVNEKDPRDYQRSKFKRYTLNLADAGTELERTNSSYRGDREMTIAMMRDRIGAQRKNLEQNRAQLNDVVRNQMMSGVFTAGLAPGRQRLLHSQLERYASFIDQDQRLIDKYLVEVYKKYAMPVACIVFVLVGAPLGIMARRGGMAIGIGMSLGFFVLYWAFLIGGEDLADRRIVSPFWAMWSANILLAIIGTYLVWAAVKDTRSINWSFLDRINAVLFHQDFSSVRRLFRRSPTHP